MVNEKPKVSIIIPTYNRANLIGRAIQSVLDQTYKDFELIIVDDGSIDYTEDIIKEFQKKDKRIKYIRREKNRGGSAARNTGIKAARGEYIAFQDSDDEWLPEKLEKQMNVFENAPAEVGVVYTGFLRIKNDKKTYTPSSWVTQKEGNIYKELLKGNFVTTQSIVMRKECFVKTGMFDENLPRLQDWELVIRLSKYYDFKCVDEPLMISYYTSNSISANQNALMIARKLILEKYFEDIKKNKKVLAKHYFDIGFSLCSNGDFQEGKDYLIKAVKANPLNVKFLLVVFLSFFGQRIFNKAIECYRKVKNIKARDEKCKK
jgi:glycosyltransferase involved in cell wall biosynthesis